MSSDEIAIRVRDVSKHYLLFNQPQDRLKQSIMPRLQRLAGRQPKRYYRDFAALSHVSFEVRRGETVGIIGRNGSGKSTLLQVVCGTLRPNNGTVEVNGRIAALLELGAGFNPEFTGRENVYLNGAILGLARGEIDRRFADIARFADIGDFIDQPVKTYSSGMYVRLAFATAINVDPDILVVDEALAVGDEAFQRKCFARIEQIQERGGTILFVTHGVQTVVQLCTRALLFDRGELLLDGPPKLVTSQYQRLINLNGDEATRVREELRSIGADMSEAERATEKAAQTAAPATAETKWMSIEGLNPDLVSQSRLEYETQGARIRDPRILNTSGEQVNVLETGKQYYFEFYVDFSREANDIIFGTLIKTREGTALGGAAFQHSRLAESNRVAAGTTIQVRIAFRCILLPGVYFFNAGVMGATSGQYSYLHRILDAAVARVVSHYESVGNGWVDFDARATTRILRHSSPNEGTFDQVQTN